MADEISNNGTIDACPYLGLAGDSTRRCIYVTASHRCFRGPVPEPVDEEYQASFCLTTSHQDCLRFAEPDDPLATGEAGPGLPRGRSVLRWLVAAGSVSLMALSLLWGSSLLNRTEATNAEAVVATEPTPATSGSPRAGEALQPPIATAASERISLAAAPSPSPAPVSQPIGTGPAPATATQTRTTTASTPAQPTSVSAAPARSTATPVATVSSQPVAVSPTSFGVAPRSYVVQPGDTLFSISRSFGVKVDDIVEANGLKDRNSIRAGQRLVIPSPR